MGYIIMVLIFTVQGGFSKEPAKKWQFNMSVLTLQYTKGIHLALMYRVFWISQSGLCPVLISGSEMWSLEAECSRHLYPFTPVKVFLSVFACLSHFRNTVLISLFYRVTVFINSYL